MKSVLFVALVVLASLSGQSQEYPKAILPGDYPDPSVIRNGEDYYMTHSPFYYAPGFLIWHSKDLMNWEPVCRAITEYKGSAMAPDLVKYKGKYYIYYPAAGAIWVVWADNIKGPWSKPIDLKVTGIDPGHIADENGNRYLYVNEGEVIQLTEDGLATIGQKKKVYEGWAYPKNWTTECMCLESPKLNYHNGYYYLISAEGGTAGPATSHMVVAARSKSILGPWENSPYNPVVHTYNPDENWWSKGHATLIDDVNGNWWMVYHAYANGYHTLGRQTLIEPVEWTSDGWFRTKDTNPPVKPATTITHGLELSDDFKGDSLGIQWTFWKEYAPQALTFKQQSLFVKAKGKTPADARLLLTTATDKNYETQVEITTGKGNIAGLLLYYNEKAYAGIISNGSRFIIYKNAGDSLTVPNKMGKHFYVKLHNQGNNVTMYASSDGNTWMSMIENLDVSGLNHNKFGGFYALRIGLLSAGKGSARFNQFRYKNAVPQEKDMSAYLMVFHKDETHGLYMALSPDGYHFTALNNAKPVMAGDTIAMQKGIRDPHIFRGPDGGFYLAMTDLHVFAKRDGIRNTEWERDGRQYGWGNNRALVLMKSWDLINWKRTNIRFDTLSAGLSEIGCVWAPETIYDEKKGKLMIYFTMRFKNEKNKLYYVYVNDDFNKIETLPQLLFQYPNPQVSDIDGDITKVGDTYRLFYVAHEGHTSIRQATSASINSDYRFDARNYDPEKVLCEAPNVWKRIGENKWVLMYDVFGLNPANFGFSETSDFVNFTDLGHFNEGVMKTTNFTSPKHGAIIHVTKEEAMKLAQHWGLSYDSLSGSNNNQVGQLQIFNALPGVALNNNFTVQVRLPGQQWQPVTAYNVKVTKMENGHTNAENASLAYFNTARKVEVAVRLNEGALQTARIRPLSYGITPRLEGNTLYFTIDKPCNLSVEVNGDIFHNLHLFANPIYVPVDSLAKNVIWFGAGLHELKDGVLRVPSNTTVYVAGGAFIKGRFLFDSVSNSRLLGYGIIDPSGNGISIEKSKNIEVEGVISSRCFTGGSTDVSIKNVKVISAFQWGDGMNVVSSNNVLLDGVFNRNSDDCTTVYGTRGRYSGGCNHVTMQNATLWADVAHPILIGTHGSTPNKDTLQNLSYINIDILDHNEPQIDYQGCMSIDAGDNNLVRNVRFENIRVEDFRKGQLFNVRVFFNTKYCTSPGRGVENVLFKNIVYNGKHAATSVVDGYDGNREVKNIVFENLYINGKLYYDGMKEKPGWYKTADLAGIYVGNHTEGIVFKKSE